MKLRLYDGFVVMLSSIFFMVIVGSNIESHTEIVEKKTFNPLNGTYYIGYEEHKVLSPLVYVVIVMGAVGGIIGVILFAKWIEQEFK